MIEFIWCKQLWLKGESIKTIVGGLLKLCSEEEASGTDYSFARSKQNYVIKNKTESLSYDYNEQADNLDNLKTMIDEHFIPYCALSFVCCRKIWSFRNWEYLKSKKTIK